MMPYKLQGFDQTKAELAAAKTELLDATRVLQQFVTEEEFFLAFDADDITQENANDYLLALDIGVAFDRVAAAKVRLNTAEGNFLAALQQAKDAGLV